MWSASIWPKDGRADFRSTLVSSAQRRERTRALVHWRKTSSTSTTSPLRGARRLTARGSRERGIGGEGRAAVEPERLVHPRNQEQHPDERVLEHVRERVRAVVPAPIGKEDGLVVEDRDEARGVAARRAVDPPVRPGGRKHDEGRQLDEPPAMPVQAIERLPDRPLARRPVAAPQLLHRLDDVLRHFAPRTLAPNRG